MKPIIANILLVFFYCTSQAQVTTNEIPAKRKLFIHYYSSALVYGDVSFGAEYLHKKNTAQELSLNWRIFPKDYYIFYDKGFRCVYQLKHHVVKNENFRISLNFSLLFHYLYFENKLIDYQYVYSPSIRKTIPLYSLLENRYEQGIGGGFGASFYLKVCKRLYAGSDILFNLVQRKTNYEMIRLVGWNIKGTTYNGHPFPHQYSESTLKLEPLVTLKLGYQIF